MQHTLNISLSNCNSVYIYAIISLCTSIKNKNVHTVINGGYLCVPDILCILYFFKVSKYKWDTKLKASNLCKKNNLLYKIC